MAASDLTTIAEVKVYLGLSDAALAATIDPVLSALITSQSAWLTSQCRRNSFLEQPYTEVRNGNGARGLTFFNEHATAITSVKINGETIDPFVMPAPGETADPGFVLVNDRVELVDSSNSLVAAQTGALMLTPGRLVFTQGFGNVTIVYTAGWTLATLPADIGQAVIELVALRYKERERPGIQASGGTGGETLSFLRASSPPSVQDVIETYRTRWVG